MRRRLAGLAAATLLVVAGSGTSRAEGPITVVAAENFYGDVAKQIGGPDIFVTSILNKPDDDPHMFEASASVARSLAEARVVIASGADYDPWVEKLLAASPSAKRKLIVVADLVHRASGENPHIWYEPQTMPAFAETFAAVLIRADPAHQRGYQERRDAFLASLRPIHDKVRDLREKFAGTPVTATEPVFGDMAGALDLKMRNLSFQLAVMNDTEPSAGDVARFEDDLRGHKVKLFIYNSQATDESAKRLKGIARDAKIPVVGVTETEPAGTTYQDWMLGELKAVEAALSGPSS